jgi:hypothetical protein
VSAVICSGRSIREQKKRSYRRSALASCVAPCGQPLLRRRALPLGAAAGRPRSYIVAPPVTAGGAVEEERHALLRAGREEDRLVVVACGATRVLGPGQRGVGPYVLQVGACACGNGCLVGAEPSSGVGYGRPRCAPVARRTFP